MEKIFQKFIFKTRFFGVLMITSLFFVFGNAQHLTIATSGETGTSGVNWSISGNILNVAGSGSANIHPSVIVNHLTNVGDLTVNLPWQSNTPRNMNINANISYAGGSNRTLTLNCANDILFDNATSINATAAKLNLVLRTALGSSNTDHGRIQLNGVTIQTNGGHIWAGGGSGTATWNGLTVGNSFSRTWLDDLAGVSIVGSSITTNGGELYVAGLSHENGDDNGENFGVKMDNSTISTATGSIELIGEVRGRFTRGIGMHLEGNSGVVSILTTTGSISINGYGYDSSTNGNGWRHGAFINQNVVIRTVSGNISILGEAQFTAAVNDKEGLILGNNTSICSQSGNLTFRGTNTLESSGQNSNAIRFSPVDAVNSLRIGFDGTNPYTGNILIEGNSIYQRSIFQGAGSIAIQTSGNLTIQPTGPAFTYMRAGDAGTLTFDDDWNFGTTLGGFTYGKSTNTSNLTWSRPLTTSGAIRLYAGNITVQQNLTTTANNAEIFLQGNGYIELAASQTIQTNNGNITFRANAGGIGVNLPNGTTGAITLNNASSLLSNGGNITLGGNFDGTEGTGLYATSARTGGSPGILINNATLTAAGGNINIYGKCNTSYDDGVRIQANITTTGTGNIGIYGDAYGGYNGTQYFGGISFFNTASSIETNQGNITLSGKLINTQNNSTSGINFYRQIGSPSQTNHIQLISRSGNVQINGDRGSTSANGINHYSWGNVYFGSPQNNSWIATGNVIFTYSSISGSANNGFKVITKGAVTYQPVSGSFASAETFPFNSNYTVADSATGLTIGKPGNTADITIGGNLSVEGPITISGGTIYQNANITATSAANIALNGTAGFYTSDTRKAITSAGGNITINADIDANGSGVLNLDFLTINPGPGNIIIRGESFNWSTANDDHRPWINGTGSFTMESNDASFNANLNTIWFKLDQDNNGMSGLTLGKSTEINAIVHDHIGGLSVAGPITLQGGFVEIRENLFSTAPEAKILFKAKGWVWVNVEGKTVQSNNGDITFWADTDNSQSSSGGNFDEIGLRAGVTVNTQGGKLIMAGGLDDGANGGVASDGIPDNYAYRGSGEYYGGVNLGVAGETGSLVSVLSGGGDVIIKGRSAFQGFNSRPGVTSQGNLLVNSGIGRINIQGISTVNHGIEFTYGAVPNIAITSAYGGVGPAITMAGGSTSNDGIRLITVNSGNVLIQSTASTGGGILMEGSQTLAGNTAILLANQNSTSNIQLLSANGDINIRSSAVGSVTQGLGQIYSYGNIYLGNRLNATAVQGIIPSVINSSANVLYSGNNVLFDNLRTTKVGTTGTFTVAPRTTDNSFSAATTIQNIDISTVSAFTAGKAGNTAALTISSALTAAAPMTFHGAAITIGGALTATNNTINLHAAGAVTQTAAITGSNLGLHGTGTFTLNNTGNNVTTLAGGENSTRLASLSFTDASGGLTIGTVGTKSGIYASGTVLVETLTGDLTIAQNISTTNTTSAAITANAGKNATIGMLTGGDIKISGSPMITMGTGGIVRLFSGSSTQSTGLDELIGNQANVRNTADETTSTFLPALEANKIYAIYRTSRGTGDLTIVSSGGDAEGTTWIYENGVIATISSPVNIRDSIIQRKLLLGDVSIEANKVTFDANINHSTSNAFKVLSKTHIWNNKATTISSNGGDVLLASNVDNATDYDSTVNGYINFRFGLTINSNGGNITFGGGNTAGSDYALGSNVEDRTEGVRFDQIISLNSAGGNITLRGKSYARAVQTGWGASGVGFYHFSGATGIINSGTGTITIDGFSQTNTSSYSAGIYSMHNMTITSANTTADAIRLIGKATGASGEAWGIETENTFSVLATGDGGGITISTSQQLANNYDAVFRGETNILANSGSIQLLGKQDGGVANGIWYVGGNFYLGSKASSAVTQSATNITIQYDRYEFYSNPRIATSGTVNWKPASNSFGQAVYTNWFLWNQNSQTISGLTIGKAGNSASIYPNTPLTIAGPISLYAGTISVSANVTSSANGDILFKGILTNNPSIQIESGITVNKSSGTGTFMMQGHSRVINYGNITATGSGVMNVILWSDFDNSNNDGGVTQYGTISTNGGHVWMGGSSSNGGSYTWNGITVGDGPSIGFNGYNCNAVDLFGPITTAGGDVFIWAGSSAPSCGSSGIVSDGTRLINAGSGDITFISRLTAGTIQLTSTGTITMVPNGGSYASDLTVGGTTTSGNFTFNTGHYSGVVLNSMSNVGGLIIGRYTGMIGSDTAVVMGNTSNITMSAALSIAGPIEVYGGAMSLNAQLTTADTLTGNIIFKGTSFTGTSNLALPKTRNVTIDVSATSTYDGIISGNQASLTKAGSGLLTLTKDHTYSGLTRIMRGKLQVGSGGSVSQASSGTINSTSGVVVDSSAKLVLAPNEDMTFTRPVSGAGGLEIKGMSGLYLNTFLSTSPQVIATNTSVLEVLHRIKGGTMSGTAASGDCGAYVKVYNVLDNTATFQFQNYSGSGGTYYTKTVFARLQSSGNNVTISINNTPYNTGAAYTSPNILGTDMTTGYTQMVLATNAGASGYGISKVYMSGKVNFTGALTYQDTTVLSNTVTSGTLPTYSFTSKGTQEITDASSSFPGALINNGLVIFKRATPLTISGNMSGTEEILQLGAPITLTGNNTLSGLITIAKDSSLLVGAGGTTGSVTGNIVNYGKLTFHRSDSSAYPGVLSGSGSLIKSGQGALLMTGANNYTGATMINAGKLIFERDIPATASSSFSGNGLLEIRSSSASFTNLVTYPIASFNVSTSIGGLTIGKPGNTANITLIAPVKIAGPVSFYGGDLAVNHNITTNTSGADVLLQATGKINLGASDTISTNAGDVNLWADADANATGYVQMLSNSAIVTTGGDIHLGGGSNLTTGYAFGTTAETCPEAIGTQYISGVHLRSGTSLNSNGGNITIRGQNANTTNSAMSFGVGFRGSVINSGTGKIAITGVATGSGSVNAQAVSNWDQIRLESASTASDAISITGDALNVSNAVTAMGMNLHAIIEATGTGGGITLNGASGTATGTQISTSFYGDLLAVSGPITVKGSNSIGTNDNVIFPATTVIGKKAGTNVTTSGSHVTIEGNVITATGAVTISSIGSLTVRPYESNFASAFTWPMTNVTVADVLTGLTLGKSNNTANITIAQSQSIAGPVSIFGGKININGALSATNNINLHAQDSVIQTAPIKAGGLGLHGPGHFILNHTSNNVVKLAGGDSSIRLGSLHFVDTIGGLEIGSVNPTGIFSTGHVLIETLEGDINLNEPVESNSSIDSLTNYNGAIVMNAGKNLGIRTPTGGGIKVSGNGNVSAPNGIIKLYSGNPDDSEGLNSLVGGTANTRLYVDENTTTFNPPLTSKEKFALYRDRVLCFVDTASISPTVCINTNLPLITHVTDGPTGIGIPSGLPAGVTAQWASNAILISGTPSEAGTFNYTIPLTGNCGSGNPVATGTITVDSLNTVGTASATPMFCVLTPMTNITHATTGATGIDSILGLPLGVSAIWASNTITISGTPTQTGVFNYSILLTGGCGRVIATGTINVTPGNTVSAASSTPTVCLNATLTSITHTTSGATGIDSILGLPLGVIATWASNTITISGTPTQTGVFNYSILLTGGCGRVIATGTINVNPGNTVTVASSTPTLCINSTLTDIIHKTTGATGIGTPNGLPNGVTARWASDSIFLSGIPSEAGIFTYEIPLTGGCGAVIAQGTITVTVAQTVSAASSTDTVCINTLLTNIKHATTGVIGIGTPTGLPAGVTANWALDTIVISGTPTMAGIYTYSIPLTGGCGSVSAAGTITVKAIPTATITVTDQSGLTNNDGTICVGMDAILTAKGGSAFTWGDGSTNSILKVSPTTSTAYAVTVVDNDGCSAIVNTTITVNSLPAPTVTSTPPVCPLSQTGTATASTGSGWSYRWSNDSTTQSINNLVQGLYVVTVTDVNGCKGTASTNLVDATSPITIAATKTDVVCYGAQTGAISLAVTGGTTPYSYNWSANAQGLTSANLTNLPKGNYTVTVTEDGVYKCKAVSTIEILEPSFGMQLNLLVKERSGAKADDGIICTSEAATIKVNALPNTGRSIVSYLWSVTGNTDDSLIVNTAGSYSVTVTDNQGCSASSTSSAITVISENTVSAASSAETLCINTLLTNITHTTTGATGIGPATGLPAGVIATWASNTITISGTPTIAGTFNYNIPLTGGCGDISAIGTITVTELISVSSASSSPTLCMNTLLTGIIHTTTGLTGIGTPIGLPEGVNASWSNNTLTISGTPMASGTFNYTIPIVGECGSANATGTFTVNPSMLVSVGNATQTLCVNTELTNISFFTSGGATGIGTPTNLPMGVTASWSANTISIVGTPKESGTFNYAIPLTGGCGNVNATGTIIVRPENTVSAASSTPTLCANTLLPEIKHSTVGATGIVTVTGLPSGVTANWSADTISITGIPEVSGIFRYELLLSGGCGNLKATGTITVSTANTVGVASSYPTLCVNTPLTNITHRTRGATGIGAATGLPDGVKAEWASDIITISGTPLVSGVYVYIIPLTGGCDTMSAIGVIRVNPINTVSPASATPTLCIQSVLADITHTTTGAIGIGTATGLPAGVSATWSANVITISGTPTASGTFNYSIPLTGGCGSVTANGTITVNPNNTVSAASATPTLCIQSVLADITHTTTGATGIGTATGLPAGVSATWSENVITISGTPTASGTFNYSIPLTGGCGSVTANGTITVNPNNTVSAASATPTLCIQSVLADITHTTTGATGIGTATGLPAGVSATWSANVITISGTPTASGTFNYSIPLTGGCGSVTANGTITVKSNNTVSAASATPTVCIQSVLADITHTTTGATGIGTATGLPAGVSATWSANVITISGTPTASGTFNYSIPVTGGCGTISATGKIIVLESPKASVSVTDISGLVDDDGTICAGDEVILTASGGATFVWGDGQTNSIIAVSPKTTTEYAVSVLDENGCSAMIKTTIVVNTLPVPTVSITNPDCKANVSGSALATAGSGWSYLWSNGSTTAGITGLTQGQYVVTVTDEKGCEGSATATLADASVPLSVTVSKTDVVCPGIANGSISLNTSGGSKPYAYEWSTNVKGLTTSSLTNLASGIYSVTVTEGGLNRCKSVSTIEIEEPTFGLLANIVLNENSGEQVNDGIICQGDEVLLSVNTLTNEGSSIASYLWSDILASKTKNIYVGLAGNYSVTITDSKGCSTSVNATVSVMPVNTVSVASASPTLCVNTPLTKITHRTSGATGIGSAVGLPVGVTASWASNMLSISGTPTIAGVFYYTIPLLGGCDSLNAKGTIIVSPVNTVEAVSTISSVCVNTILGNISFNTTGATGIGTATGLPNGLTAIWTDNVLKIVGIPTEIGTFNYSIPLIGGCGDISAKGIISVVQEKTVSAASSIPSICINTNLTEISHTTTGATGIGTAIGLPAGVMANWAANVITISGKPTESGIFSYSIPLTGSCGMVSAMGTIIVKEVPNASIMVTETSGLTNNDSTICAGSTAIISATGGSSFVWNSGEIQNILSVSPNVTTEYSVTVTADDGCAVVLKKRLIVDANPMPVISTTNPNCVLLQSGTATSSTNVSWSYLWSNGASTPAITGLSQGAYMLTVTDEKGCKGTALATLTDTGLPIALNLSKSDVDCYGSSTGAITVNVTGGNSPYLYKWSSNAGGSTTPALENLAKGNYSVTVTENGSNKCEAVGTINITEPSFPIQASVIIIENSGAVADDGIICQDQEATLFVNALPSPDATITSYQWSDAAGTEEQSMITGLAGVYTVTVTDSKGCKATATSGAISLIPKNEVSVASSTPTICVQKAIPNITHTTSGATGIGIISGLPSGVTASWLANTITISGTPITVGIFNYSIQLIGGCDLLNATGTITVIPPNIAEVASYSPTLCINTSMGKITHKTSGASGIGTSKGLPAGLTANWSDNVITISGTPTQSGTFNYTIPLTGGCDTVSATGKIVVIPSITVSDASSSPTLCVNNALTEIRHTVANGTGIGLATGLPEGVVASWIPGSVIISGTPLVSGTFNYTISIIGGCGDIYATGTMAVTPTNTVSLASSKPTICINTALTNIMHSTTGATGIGTATGLPAGVSATWSANVITISGTPTASGIFNYSVPLKGGCGNVTATGTIIVTSANDAFIVITDKSGLVNNDGIICAGDEVILIAKGGSSFVWNGGETSSILSVSPLTTTEYSVLVSSDNGCNSLLKTKIVVNTLPVPTVTSTNPDCSLGQNGTALASTGNGWSYLWSNGSTTANISGLSQGQYIVTVTDDKGCEGTATATLNDVSLPLTIGVTKTDVLCQGGSNGTIKLNVVGGSSPYAYAWSANALGATTSDLTNLSSGIYSVTVTEGSTNQCKVVSAIEISEPSFGVQTNIVIKENSGVQANDGIICPSDFANIIVTAVSPSGASISSYSWNNPSGSSSNSIIVSEPGLYIVTITDSRGCRTTASNKVTLAPNNLVGAASSSPTLCINGLLTNITHKTTGATGIGNATGLPAGVTATWASNTITISGSPSESGIFNYIIPLIGGCSVASATGTITVKDTKEVSIAVTDKSGLRYNDGTICEGDDIVLSATGAASYVWSGGDTSSILFVSPNISSEYSVTATHSDGCVSTAKTIILVNPKPKLSLTTTNTDCLLNQTGSASVSTGNNWSYLWSNGSVSPTISGLLQGQYKVTVTDEKGCKAVSTATLTDRSVPLTIDVSKTDVVCPGASDGTISLNVRNGSSPYTYVWSSNLGGATSASLTNLPKGNYQVTVTEGSGNSCKAVRSIEIMEPSFGIQTNISVSEKNGSLSNEGILCHPNEVIIKVNAVTITGASISSYLWNNAQRSTSRSITADVAGVYTVTVTDSRGCQTTASTTIITASGNTVSAASSTPSLCVNTVLNNITHTTSGATGIGLVSGLPKGVIANWSANLLTISGTPQESGTFNYTIPLIGGCGLVNATGSIIVGSTNTVNAPSSTPTLCVNSELTTITHNTTGATGIGVASGLPPGINASWFANTISLSGSPTVSGTYNYSIPLTGGCGTVIAAGTITVSPISTVTAASSTPTLNINRILPNITHTTTGISGIGAASGLPNGVNAVWSANVVTISGVPTTTGIFNYSIALTGGCGILHATGTIIVNKNDQVDSLLCGNYLIDNLEIYKDELYSGVIILSYKGGNGGDFTGKNLSSTGVTGLNITLQPGKLAVGDGSLEWVATGVPTDTGKAIFNLAIGAKTCIIELPVTLLLPKLSSLDCNNSQLTPDDLGKDVAYNGVLKLNYQGGNNGKVRPITISSTGVTGLTLTGDSLRLNPSGGTLMYAITGTPTSTGVAGFTITVGDKTCQTLFPVIDNEVKLSSFFTPNGDGTNDRWEIPALVFYPESKVFIFDRTGRLLVEYAGDSPGWDGLIGGLPASSGDYWYVIQVTKDDIRKGNFTLIK